mgnify:CR=1 FL=1
MKYLRFLLTISPLLIALPCQSINITQQEWLTVSYTVKSELRDNNALPDNPTSAKDILLVSQFIKELQWQKDFTAKQLHQLNKWKRSDAVLVLLPESDAEKPQTLIDISAEAKNTFLTIQSREAAEDVYQKWQRDEFTPADLNTFTGQKGDAIFKTFFNRLPLYLQTGFKDWSIEQFKDPSADLKQDYSAMVAHMATMLGDIETGNYLFELPVTEHTMSFLDSIVTSFAQDEQLMLLKNASENSKLKAKSYQLLAQHFARDKSVAVLVAEALQSRNDYWQALNLVPAFVKAGNTEAFENVIKQLEQSQQEQLRVRLKQKN